MTVSHYTLIIDHFSTSITPPFALISGGNNRMVSDVNGVLSVVHAVFMYLMYIRAILRRRYAVWYAVCCC